MKGVKQEMEKGGSAGGRRFVILDCDEEIPCNPCEEACRRGAIAVGDNINAVPSVDEERCNGCGDCIGVCPGSCVFLVEELDGKEAAVTLAYDRLPRPRKGDVVDLVDGGGSAIGQGIVSLVKNIKSDRHLRQVTIRTEMGIALSVRSFKPSGAKVPETTVVKAEPPESEDFLICRCEEVLYSEFAKVVEAGVRHASSARLLTRTGMGLCQGKACTETLLDRLSALTGMEMEDTGVPRSRPPVRPVSLGELGG